MPLIKCKAEVKLQGLTAGLAWMLFTLERVVRTDGQGLPAEVVITSLNDGKHATNSRHYVNEAMDIRTLNFPSRDSKRVFREKLERALNSHPSVSSQDPRFRVLIENEGKTSGSAVEHIHVQVAKGKTFP